MKARVKFDGLVGDDVISLADAKTYLKVYFTAEDAIISSIIPSARRYAERTLGYAIVPQNFTQRFDTFPIDSNGESENLRLYTGPVTAIASILYYDENDVQQTLDPSKYTFDAFSRKGQVIPLDDWPSVTTKNFPDKIEISYTAGLATPDSDHVQAIYKLIGEMWIKREDRAEKLPTSVTQFLTRGKIWKF